MEIFGVPLQAMLGQLLLGLVNGSFYAMLSLGLAVIFGLLNVINFAHGAMYMLGAYVASGWMGRPDARAVGLNLASSSTNFWGAARARAAGGGRRSASSIEKLLLKRLYKLDHLYGLLLTFGLALIDRGRVPQFYGSSGQSYDVPEALSGRDQSRLHGPAELPRLGGAGLAGGVLRRRGS
jgi:branched-chain amino acid transport system permease protein